MDKRTKKKGGAPKGKKSFKSCKKFEIKGSNETNMSKCICIETQESKSFNTYLFKCDKELGIRLKTDDEVDEDDDDETEQKYFKEVINYIKSQQDSEKLKQKKSVESVLSNIFKKYSNLETHLDVSDNVDSIYDYLTMMRTTLSTIEKTDINISTPRDMRNNVVATGRMGLNHIDPNTRLRIEKHRKEQKKRLNIRVSKKKSQFYTKKSNDIYQKLTNGIKRLRGKGPKTMSILFNNVNTIIKDVKIIKNKSQNEWFTFLIGQIKPTKDYKPTYDDFIYFIELSERYNPEDLTKMKTMIKRKFESEWTGKEQIRQLKAFFESEPSERMKKLKELEHFAQVYVDREIDVLLKGTQSDDEEKISKIAENDVRGIIVSDTKALIKIAENIASSFLGLKIWSTKNVREESLYLKGKLVYERYLKQLIETLSGPTPSDTTKNMLIKELQSIVLASKGDRNESLIKMNKLIRNKINNHQGFIEFIRYGQISFGTNLDPTPHGWMHSGDDDPTKKYKCITNESITSMRIPKKGTDEFDECNKTTENLNISGATIDPESGSVGYSSISGSMDSMGSTSSTSMSSMDSPPGSMNSIEST